RVTDPGPPRRTLLFNIDFPRNPRTTTSCAHFNPPARQKFGLRGKLFSPYAPTLFGNTPLPNDTPVRTPLASRP
ncbi:MAG: hypothetical protein AAF911_12475, partial [Planctomycetota bacterium]